MDGIVVNDEEGNERIVALRTLVEATLDFPEEEVEFIERANGLGRLVQIEATLAGILATARQGALLTEGLSVVLVGAPNVGKSSLMNALAGADVAIVTPVAGTTRDRITQLLAIDGVVFGALSAQVEILTSVPSSTASWVK